MRIPDSPAAVFLRYPDPDEQCFLCTATHATGCKAGKAPETGDKPEDLPLFIILFYPGDWVDIIE